MFQVSRLSNFEIFLLRTSRTFKVHVFWNSRFSNFKAFELRRLHICRISISRSFRVLQISMSSKFHAFKNLHIKISKYSYFNVFASSKFTNFHVYSSNCQVLECWEISKFHATSFAFVSNLGLWRIGLWLPSCWSALCKLENYAAMRANNFSRQVHLRSIHLLLLDEWTSHLLHLRVGL